MEASLFPHRSPWQCFQKKNKQKRKIPSITPLFLGNPRGSPSLATPPPGMRFEKGAREQRHSSCVELQGQGSKSLSGEGKRDFCLRPPTDWLVGGDSVNARALRACQGERECCSGAWSGDSECGTVFWRWEGDFFLPCSTNPGRTPPPEPQNPGCDLLPFSLRAGSGKSLHNLVEKGWLHGAAREGGSPAHFCPTAHGIGPAGPPSPGDSHLSHGASRTNSAFLKTGRKKGKAEGLLVTTGKLFPSPLLPLLRKTLLLHGC